MKSLGFSLIRPQIHSSLNESDEKAREGFRTGCLCCGALRGGPLDQDSGIITRRFERKALSLIVKSIVSDVSGELRVSREILDGSCSTVSKSLLMGWP